MFKSSRLISTTKKRRSANTKIPSQASPSTLYYDQLFEHYRITDSIFKQNIKYYSERPDVLEKIMDSVVQRLTKVQSESQRDDSQ